MLSIIRDSLGPIYGKRILDIGCGSGTLAATLSSEGAKVVGIDIEEAAIESARRNAPLAEFRTVSANQLPFADQAFDAAIFVNSLHHVEPSSMKQALFEAERVLKPGGHLIVIEPLPEGSFFEAFRSIEDETAVRLEGQSVIRSFTRLDLRKEKSFQFLRIETFGDFDAFISRTTAANKSRLGIIEQNRESIRQAFEANSTRGKNGSYVFEQPLKVDIWTRVR
jgi:ubiquinone/menaquinone biosynthesis C-methylase UbiE